MSSALTGEPIEPLRSPAVMLHGLSVASPFQVSARLTSRRPDVSVASVHAPWPGDEMNGVVVAESITAAGHPSMQVFDADGRSGVLFPGFLSASTRQADGMTSVELSVANASAAGLAAVLLSPVIGALSMLRGLLVLHASAVVIDGQASLLIAPRGGGKSSIAALLCSAGAELLSEDVCALDYVDSGFVVHSGIHELRLRHTTPGLLELPRLVRVAAHTDERIAMQPPIAQLDSVRVHRLVVVDLSLEAQRPVLTPLAPVDAVAVLLAAQRCPIVAPRHRVRALFDIVSKLAATVPITVATIPWAPDVRNQRLGLDLFELMR
jgi:hypothetical protein